MAVQAQVSLGRTFGTVALLTIASKVVGLARDIVVAGAYGTTVLADAYNFAYLFTGNILILFGGLGGPFHSATVTVLSSAKKDRNVGPLVSQIAVLTFFVLAAVAALVYMLAPWIMHGIASGYGHNVIDSKQFFEESIFQLQVMSPLVVIAGLVGVSYGVLNVYDKVVWPSLSPAIASLAIIAILFIWPDRTTSVPLAVGTLVGAFGQLFAQLPDISRCGLNFEFVVQPVNGLRTFFALLWPAVFGTCIGQLTIYIDSFFCSSISEGAWTAISNANRIIQLPLGVLITATIVPMLPRLAQHAAENRFDFLKSDFLKSLRFMVFLVMPLATLLLVLARQIVELLFQRGAFTAHSTTLVTTALVFYVPSMVFYVGRDLITRAFYALQDSRTPYYVALATIAVKAALNALFVFVLHWGVGGISLATSLITALNLSLLALLLRGKIGRLGFQGLLLPFGKTSLSCVVMALVTIKAYALLSILNLPAGLVIRFVSLSVASGMGLLAYALAAYVMRVDELFVLLKRYGFQEQ